MAFETKLDDAYLDLLKKCLTRYLWPDTYQPMRRPTKIGHPLAHVLYPIAYPPLERLLRSTGLKLARHARFDAKAREEGRDWPAGADTMIGLKRLDNLHRCIEDVLCQNVPGDFIETGVWRGGACIFMRAALNAYGDPSRRVWLADSFEGLPKPDGRFAEDYDPFGPMSEALAVPIETVKENFRRYGLLDHRVCFLKGWFRDTLPKAKVDKLAILRLDGDMYSSTMDALVNLYPKLSPGGYAIVDDYDMREPCCRKAVDDYRARERITAPIRCIDGSGVFWQKPSV